MAYLVFLGFIFAISWWLDTKRKRREARHRTAIELQHGQEEGLPAPGTRHRPQGARDRSTLRSRSSTIRPRFTAPHAGVVPKMPPL